MAEGEEFHTTFASLNCWFKHVFRSLGWMQLARHHGHTQKLRCYVESIAALEQALQHKMRSTRDPDRVNDLKQMLYNVKILAQHAQDDFGDLFGAANQRGARSARSAAGETETGVDVDTEDEDEDEDEAEDVEEETNQTPEDEGTNVMICSNVEEDQEDW